MIIFGSSLLRMSFLVGLPGAGARLAGMPVGGACFFFTVSCSQEAFPTLKRHVIKKSFVWNVHIKMRMQLRKITDWQNITFKLELTS
jgi:hypothetical protein